MTPTSPFMRLSEVQAMVRLSRWTIWRLVSEGEFPAPVRVSPRRAYYLATEVERWIASRRPDERRTPIATLAAAQSASPSSGRVVGRREAATPAVGELLIRSGRPLRVGRRAAAAAARRRLYAVG